MVEAESEVIGGEQESLKRSKSFSINKLLLSIL